MPNPNLKILITGGSGFIGQALVERLGDTHQIFIVDRNFGQNPKATYLNKSFEFLNSQEWENTDVLIHLAWSSAPATSFTYAQEFLENIKPSKKLFDQAIENKVKRIVFLSSAGAVYGNVPTPFVESGPTKPVSAYGQAKLSVEEYLREVARSTSWVIARPTNVIGLNQKAKRGQGLIPTIIQSLNQNQTLKIRGNAQKDYLAIDDLVPGLEHLITAPLVRGIFNIGSGEIFTTKEIIAILEKKLDKIITYEQAPLSSFDVQKVEVDTTKISQRFGWNAKVNIKKLIQKIATT